MTTPETTTSSPSAKKTNAFWVNLILLISAAGYLSYSLIADWPPANIYVTLNWLNIAVAFLGILASFILLLRQRTDQAMRLLIGAIWLAIILSSLTFAGQGLLVGLAGIIVTTGIATITLSGEHFGRTALIGVGVALLTVVLDIYGSPNRPAFEGQTVLLVTGTILTLILVAQIFRQFNTYSVSTKLILGFLVVSLVPLAMLVYVNSRTTSQALTALANQSLQTGTVETASSVDKFIETTLAQVMTEAQLPGLIRFLEMPATDRAGSDIEREAAETLRVLRSKDFINIASYALLDENGFNVLDTNSSDIGINEAINDYFLEPKSSGQPYLSPVRFPPTAVTPQGFHFSVPIRNIEGRIIGVLRLRYSVAILQQLIIEAARTNPNATVILLDENQLRLAQSHQPQLLFKTVAPLPSDRIEDLKAQQRLPFVPAEQLSTDLPAFSAGLNALDESPFFEADLISDNNDLEVAAATRLTNQPWTVVFAQPRNLFLVSVQEQLRNSLLFGLLVGGVVIGIAIVASQYLANPITRLTEVASRVAAGDLSARVQTTTSDEVGALGTTFNKMTAQLQGLIETLESRVQDRTQALVTSSEVSRGLSTILEQNELIKAVVNQVREAFNYYHTQVYLLDESAEKLMMVGGTGQAGQKMLDNKHHILVGQGLVGRAFVSNQAVLVRDTLAASNWLPNPLLSKTKSEIAVPIAIGHNILGVLDVQHHLANGLGDEDVILLQSIANQLAIALQNARQYEEVQRRVQEIAESTRFLDSVLENLPNMLFVKDAQDLSFVRWNRAAEELTGFTSSEMIGKGDYDFFSQEHADTFTNKDREVLGSGVLVDIPEEELHTLHHGTRILHTRKVPILGADGKPRYLLGISEDITEQKAVASQLESRVAQLNLLSEIGRKSEETHSIPQFLQWMSERLPTAVKHSEIALVAITLDNAIYGNERAIYLPRQIVEGLRIDGELVGRIYIAYDSPQDFGDEESALLGSIGQRVANYIETQRLQDRSRLLASIVENHPDFIGIGSLQGQALYINPSGLQMSGYPLDYSIEGKSIKQFYPQDDAEKLLQEGVVAALQSGYWSDEGYLLRHDSSTLPVEETVGINYDVNGQPVSFNITMRDITERRQTAEALAKQAKQMQIVTEVGIAAASIDDPLELMLDVVNRTKNGFDLYHTQIFLVDNFNNTLLMAAGSGHIGQELLAEKPVIQISSPQSVMAQAVRNRRGVVVGNVQDITGYLSHPLLEPTRSEIAVPLIVGDELLGVLDVQADETGYFNEDDLPVYMTLATQVAIAIQNVRQYEETQRTLAELQTLQRTMTREGWQTFMLSQKRPIRGYHANQAKLESIADEAETGANIIKPVIVLGQAIGGVAIRGDLSPENQSLLDSISQQVGQALERARLAEQTQIALSETEQQALRLAQLNEMAAAINAAATLEEVLQLATQGTQNIFTNDEVSLTLFSATSQLLVVYELAAESGALTTNSQPLLEGTAISHALRENKLISSNDLAHSPYSEQQKLYQAGIMSAMVAPLSTRSGVIGTLNIASNRPNAFEQTDENLLLQVATLVATTIESRRLFVEVEERAEELAVINRVAQAVSQQLDPDQLMGTILTSVRQVMQVDHFLVSTYEPATNLLNYLIVYDQDKYYQPEPTPLNAKSRSYKVISTGESILSNYTPAELELIKQQSPALINADSYPSSAMFAPLVTGQQVTGVISVQSYSANAYTEADMAVLIGIANHVAVALENARLFTEAQRRADRERLVNEITRKIQGTTSMESALQTAVRELGTALQAKNAQVALNPTLKTEAIQTNGPSEQTVTAD